MSTVQESYTDLITVLRELGPALSAATAVQYEAPPQSGSVKEKNDKGVKNPTLEIVLDPRRMAVSGSISDAAAAIRQATSILSPHVPALRASVARWEGSPEGVTA